MLKYEKNWVRLPLQNAYNVRELGGYPTLDGNQTVYHRFLRADDLGTLTDADVEFLTGYGVCMVIDLRSDGEIEQAPDRLRGLEGVEYIRVPFLGRDVTDATQMTPEDMKEGLVPLYRKMLENKEAVKEIFTAVAQAKEGCILFHCTAGKDRTGVMAMILMGLAGVDRQDCMTNYAQSYVNLCRNKVFTDAAFKAEHAGFGKMMYSQPETIGECYDYVLEKYGSMEHYLKECGLTEEQIEKINNRLLKEII